MGLRLVGGAVLAIAAARVFGLEGPARQAGILEAAMPSAVVTIILASEYEVEPSFVTSVVFVTTLLCPFTLTPLMALLGVSPLRRPPRPRATRGYGLAGAAG